LDRIDWEVCPNGQQIIPDAPQPGSVSSVKDNPSARKRASLTAPARAAVEIRGSGGETAFKSNKETDKEG